MAIQQSICASFKLELPNAIHNFTSDIFNMALYSSLATLNGDTAVYSDQNEIIGAGYVAGGKPLTLASIVMTNRKVLIDFEDVIWEASELTARGALVYNTSKANRAVFVLNFGTDKTSVNSSFYVAFPPPDEFNAILRVV